MTGRTPEFVQLLTGSQSRLYTFICTLLAGGHGVQDVLQETNLVLWEKADLYDPDRPFLPWACTFAHLQVLAWRKKHARGRLVFDEDLVRKLADDLIDRDVNLDRQLESLEDCLSKLHGRQRQLLNLRYLHNESVQAIAASQQKSPNAVAAILYRLRKALSQCIAGVPDWQRTI